MRLEVVGVLVEVFLREDDVPWRREIGQQRGRRELELEHDGGRIGGLDPFDGRVGLLPHAPDARRWKDDLVVGGLDVAGGQWRAVVEPNPLADLEGVARAVRRDLPVDGHVTDDLRVVVWIDLQQRAVQGRHQLDVGERAFLVGIEARRVGADHREQDAAPARRLRRLERDRAPRHDDRGDQEGEGTDGEQPRETSDSGRHVTPPRTWNANSAGGRP